MAKELFDKESFRICLLERLKSNLETGKKYTYDNQILKLIDYFNKKKQPNDFLVVSGIHGAGKSYLMNTIANFTHMYKEMQTIKFVRSYEITDKLMSCKDFSFTNQYVHKMGLCIDDYGYGRNVVNVYGQEIKPVEEVIYRRWDEHGMATMFTTNIAVKDEFIKQFDDRVVKRMAPNLKWFVMKEKDYRVK